MAQLLQYQIKILEDSKIILSKKPLNLLNNINSTLRKSSDINTIAITGSAGKTSVKELTGFV